MSSTSGTTRSRFVISGRTSALLVDAEAGHSFAGDLQQRAMIALTERFLAHHLRPETPAAGIGAMDARVAEYIDRNLLFTDPSLDAALR